ncbi:MAG TPA: GNVR domain-containing protein [Bryobacteraceae bacterium]|nr:GNVR domain-containing protein [Bryobacteraceae bacterium]
MKKSKLPIPQLAPLSVARMIWKQKFVIAATWAVLAGAGAYVISRLPDVYSAEAVVLVDPQRIPERFVAATVQVSPQDQLATINQQILSSGKLQNIIDEFHLYTEERKNKSPEEVIALMRKDVKIAPDKGWTGLRPSAFRIAYEGRVPTLVASVVNRIAGLFIDESLRSREERAQGTSQFLDGQLQEARRTLETQESILRQYKMRRMGELPEQEGALMSTLTRLQAELQANQDALGRTEQNKIMLDNTLHSAEATAATLLRSLTPQRTAIRAAPAASSVAVTAPAKSSDDLRAQLDALRLRYSDDHPDVRRLRASLEMALAREKAAEAAEPRRGPAPVEVETAAAAVNPQLALELNRERERIASLKAQLQFANKEIDTRNAERRKLLAATAEYQAKLERLPMHEQELASITRDYENSRQNYRSLLDKKMSAEMASAMERGQQSERFTLLDPAKVPTRPIKPKRTIFLAATFSVSFALSLALGFLIEFPKNRFLGEWELPSEAKVIGCISQIRISPAKRGAGAGSIRAASLSASLILLATTMAGWCSRRGAL